jgi:hypothetical protein
MLNSMVRQNLFIHPLSDIKTGGDIDTTSCSAIFCSTNSIRSWTGKSSGNSSSEPPIWPGMPAISKVPFTFSCRPRPLEKRWRESRKLPWVCPPKGGLPTWPVGSISCPTMRVHDDAWLSFYQAVGRRISGGRRNIQAFSRALDRFKGRRSAGPTPGTGLSH